MRPYTFEKSPSIAREWGERRSAMVKMTRVASVATLGMLAMGLWVVAAPYAARAAATSDQGAAILYWPKIVVDTANGTDTLIRLSNTTTGAAGSMKQAHCYYINANSHCSLDPSVICTDNRAACNGLGTCVAGCSEIDFDIILTRDQPLAWHAGTGMGSSSNPFPLTTVGHCYGLPTRSCTLANQLQVCPNTPGPDGNLCVTNQSNVGGRIPPVPEDPFVGSLECVEFTLATGTSPALPDQSSTSNTLIGEATIETIGLTPGTIPPIPTVDPASYNAWGVKFLAVQGTIPANELHLDGEQYDSCPTTLILDHLFDDASSTGSFGLSPNTTDLTLVPCGSDFAMNIPGSATAQFVVFNEFEQRFSTSKAVGCFLESEISLLDTSNPLRSIFSTNVAGTIAGQTRIRPVGSSPTGRGLLGVAILRTAIGDAAYPLHQNGSPAVGEGTPDIITMP